MNEKYISCTFIVSIKIGSKSCNFNDFHFFLFFISLIVIGVSMFESMWSSMTSSIQMAEECLREGGPEIDASQPVEGVEIIAQAIESSKSAKMLYFNLEVPNFNICYDS